MTIRHVSVFKLRPGGDAAAVLAALARARALVPGIVSATFGPDAGLRERNWDFGLVYDFEDVQAYLAWDKDEEHQRIRSEIAPHIEAAQRVQFKVDE